MKEYNKNKLKKNAQQGAVQPLYETPDGQEITATKIVQGKVKGTGARRVKGKSLSTIPWISGNSAGRTKRSELLNEICKNSYRSDIKSEERPIKNMPPINAPNDEMPFSGVIINDIGAFMPSDKDHYLLGDDDKIKSKNVGAKDIEDIIELIDHLVHMADTLDKEEEYAFASFADFLIKKASEANSIDYSKKFNDLILMLNDSDVDSSNILIKDIVKKFSKYIKISMLNDANINDAKKLSYDKILKKVDGYMS
jgi:hypothetical protein